MKKDNITATTVKLEDGLYCDFKVLAVRRKLKLQHFVEKCIHLYVESDTFRYMVDDYLLVPALTTTGSFTIFTGSCESNES